MPFDDLYFFQLDSDCFAVSNIRILGFALVEGQRVLQVFLAYALIADIMTNGTSFRRIVD
jgi:hypothetical protein